MPIETASYIHQLDETYPPGNSPMREGDDHIRLLKRVVKETFPSVQGAVNLSHTDMNGLKKNVADGVPGLDSTARLPKERQHAKTLYSDADGALTANLSFAQDKALSFGGKGQITSTSDTFHINGTAPTVQFSLSSTPAIVYNSTVVELRSAGNVKLSAHANGSTTFGNAYITGHWYVNYSDERLKDVIAELDDPLHLLEGLKVIKYQANGVAQYLGVPEGPVELGLRAGEVQARMPELTALSPLDRGEDGESLSGEHYLTLDYSRLSAVAVGAINQLHEMLQWETKARIVLEKELLALKERVELLEGSGDDTTS